jgi:predicted PurR-regulated permease PerM
VDAPRTGQPRPPRAALSEAGAWRVASRTVLFVFSLLFLIWLSVKLQSVLVQVLLAVIVAAGMTPLVDRAARPYRLFGRRGRTISPPRAVVVLAVYLVLIAAIVLIGSLVIPPVVDDTEALVRNIPSYVDDFEAWVLALPVRYPFLPTFGEEDLASGLVDQIQSLVSQLGSQLSGLLGQTLTVLRFLVGFLSGALNGIFVLVLALYITQDSERILRYLVAFMPEERQDQVLQTAGRIGDRLGGWVRGQIALSAIIGAMTFVGLSLIGVRYAVLLALFAAVGEAIPLIGPIISAVPAVIVAFFQSPLQGLLTLGLYIVVQQLENNLIVPKVMERAVALHPLAVMLALLAGSELMGVAGAILSVPVAAALSVLVREVRLDRREHEQRKRALVAGRDEPANGAPAGAPGITAEGHASGPADGPATTRPTDGPPAGPAGLVAPDQTEHDPGAAGHHPER